MVHPEPETPVIAVVVGVAEIGQNQNRALGWREEHGDAVEQESVVARVVQRLDTPPVLALAIGIGMPGHRPERQLES